MFLGGNGGKGIYATCVFQKWQSSKVSLVNAASSFVKLQGLCNLPNDLF